MQKKLYPFFLILFWIFNSKTTFAQLSINNTAPNNNPSYLVQNILMGNGVTASNITFGGNANQQIGFFNGTNSNIGLDSGIVLSNGNVQKSVGPNTGNTSDNIAGIGSDVDLNTIVGSSSGNQDKAVLEFDFIPIGDSVEFKYVFASEEYHDYVNTTFNDVFGFFISGPGITGPYSNNSANIALIPGTSTPVSINNINNGKNTLDCTGSPPGPCVNCSYFVNNCGGATVQYDGFTTVLVAKAIVQCGKTYHIKMAIQDVADGALNSAVFLKAQSFTSPGIQISLKTVLGDNNMNEGCADAYINFIRSDTDSLQVVHYQITGTATNGVDYVLIPDSVILPIGEDSAKITVSLLNDGIPEGVENIIITVFNIIPCTGDTIIETATLTINEGYDLTMTSTNATIVCAKDPAIISALPTDGSPPYTYSWDNGMTGSPITVNPSVTDSFIVTASDAIGCKGLDTSIVTVLHSLPSVSAGNNSTVCNGSSVQIGGSPTGPAGSTYSWSPSSSLSSSTIANPSANPVTTTTYIVSVTDVNTCKNTDTMLVTVFNLPVAQGGNDVSICTGKSVQIGGSPTGPAGSTFSWSPSGTLNNSSLSNPTATPASTTDYIVTVTDTNTCVKKDTIKVSLFALPVALASNDTSICIGDTIQLTSSGGVNYSWGPSAGLSSVSIQNPKAFPASTSTYLVTVTDLNNCADTESVKITVNNLPSVDAGKNATICIGKTIQIGGSPTGPAGSGFFWSPNTSISSTVIANPDVSPTSNITYYVTVTDVNTCKKSDSIKISVNTLPVVSAGSDKIMCPGSSTIIGGSPTGPVGSSFLWSPSATLNNSALSNPTAAPGSNATYIVTVTDGNACVNTDTVLVSLFTPPIAIASNDTSICFGDTIQLSASGGVSYSWGLSTGLSGTSISNPLAFPSINTTYTVTVTDLNSCTDTETVNLSLFSLPIVDAGTNISICIGETTNIGGSPTSSTGTVFSWSPVTNLSNPAIANPDAFPVTTITYTVLVTDANTCSNFDSIKVTVNNLPIVEAGSDTTICDGTTVVIGGNPTGPAGSTYSWSPGTNLNSTTNSNPVANPSANIVYTVTVTDVNGCENTGSVSFIVNANPVADAGTGGTICVGDSLQLSGTGGGLYDWFPADSLTNTAISNPKAFPSDTEIFFLVVTDGNNCKDTDSVTVNVNQLPPADAGPDLWVCPNDSILISASGGTIYSWLPITGLSATNISNPKASPTDTTKYFVTVTDGNGCANIDSMILEVGPEVPTDAGLDKTICIFDSVQIGGNPTAPAGSTFSWNTSLGISDTAIANPSAYPQDTVMYYITTKNFTCTGLDSVLVIVNTLPLADAGPNVSICINDSTQLNGSGGINYVWTPNYSLTDDSISNPIAFPTDTTKYFVFVTDANGCKNIDSVTVILNPLPTVVVSNDVEICMGDSTQFNASGGTGYSWSPAGGLSDNTISSPFAFPSDTTKYVVIVTDINGCKNKDSVLVTVNPLPVITLSSDTSICIYDSTQLVATGGDSFSWLPVDSLNNSNISNPIAFPSDTIEYVVTVVDSNFCVNKDSVIVNVNLLPNAEAGPSVAICIFDSTQLNATGGTGYVWTPSDSLSDDSIPNPMAFPSDTTLYHLMVTDANGCKNSDSVLVVVHPLPLVIMSNTVEICIGDSTQISSSGGASVVWFPPDSLTDNTIFNPIAFPSDTTIYIATITDANNCKNSDSVTVIVNPLPTVSIAGNLTICFGDSSQLTASGGDNYSWLPNVNITNPNISNPFVFPADTTFYVVTVIDSNSCAKKDSAKIIVNFLPPVDAGLNATICLGDTTQLNASGALSYLWSPTDSLSYPNIFDPLAFPSDTIIYHVTGTDNNSCKSSDSIIIIVNPLPLVIISQDTEICKGDSVQLFATGGNAYVWLPSGNLSNPLIFNPIAFPSDTTTFFVTVTDGNSCSKKDSVKVEVNPLPSNILGNNLTLCIGDSVQLNAQGGDDYTWLPADSLDNPLVSNPIAFPSDTTLYIVTVVDSNGCTNSDSITIEVTLLPDVYAGADDTICFGDTIQLSASGASTYLWSPGDSLSNINISNPFAFPSDTIQYLVSGTDNKNCTNKDSVIIVVNALPLVVVSPDTQICFGDSAQLSASGGIIYSWFPQDSLSDDSIFNPLAFPADTTIYFVFVKDINNCLNKDSVIVAVNPLPSNILGNDLKLCLGDSVQLVASGGQNYSWSPADSLDNPNISNPIAFPSDTTMYIVNVVDSNSCSNSDSITIEVNTLPNVDAGLSDTICFGDTTQLNATGAVSYVWSPATGLSDVNIENPEAFPTDTTLFFVTGTDSNNCLNTDSVLVLVNPLPVIQVNGGSDTLMACSGDSVQLDASGGTNYLWSPSTGLNNVNIPNPIATITGNLEYFVSVTDSNGCSNLDSIRVGIFNSPNIDAGMDTSICTGDTIQLNATGGISYSWNPINNLSNPQIENPFAFPSITTKFFLSALDSNGCSGIDSVQIFVFPLPMVIAGNDTAICMGDSFQLKAKGAENFIWDPIIHLSNPNISNPIASPDITTEYFVTGSDSNTCKNTDSIMVIVNLLPIANAGNDTSICRESTLQLNASGGITYSWTPSIGLSNPFINNPIASNPKDSIKYFLKVIDISGCIGKDSITVKTFFIKISPDTSICFGDSAQMKANPFSGYLPYNFSWAPTDEISDYSIYNPKGAPSSSIIYFVTVTESSGCSDSGNVSIRVNENPLAGFTFKLEPSCIGAVAEFENQSKNADSYLWLFGDKQTSTKENPEHLFLYNEIMNVTLIAINSTGCDDSSSMSRNIKSFDDYFDIVVPNIFTPNGDGENDNFEIRFDNKLQECTDVNVFNRWGEMIFSSSGNQHYWSGKTFAGEDAPNGTYFYVFDINGKEFKGSVMLIR